MSVVGEEEKEKKKAALLECVDLLRLKKHHLSDAEAICSYYADADSLMTKQLESYMKAVPGPWETQIASAEKMMIRNMKQLELWQKAKKEDCERLEAAVLEAEKLVHDLAPLGDEATRLMSTTDINQKLRLIDSFVVESLGYKKENENWLAAPRARAEVEAMAEAEAKAMAEAEAAVVAMHASAVAMDMAAVAMDIVVAAMARAEAEAEAEAMDVAAVDDAYNAPTSACPGSEVLCLRVAHLISLFEKV